MNGTTTAGTVIPERTKDQGRVPWQRLVRRRAAPDNRKKIWVQHVAVDADVLRTRLSVASARPSLTAGQVAVAKGVQHFIDKAEAAANRKDPVPSRVANWWRGVLVEAAYRNIHAARAQLVDLHSEADVDAEIPGAVARAHSTLPPHDPRRITKAQLRAMPADRRRAWLRRLIEDGYESIDLKHAQLRSFRNILLMSAALIILFVALTIGAISTHPSAMPLCFPNQVVESAGTTIDQHLNCPTRSHTGEPTGGDIWVVALLGLLGGALAAAVSVRNLRGTSTPYDVPVALAWLKVPLGAFTAILGIVAIHGGFVPGFSVLDSQEQILAYALFLGFGQQAFTSGLDKRAQSLLSRIPSKEAQKDTRSPDGGNWADVQS
jgi:hypothetical protein